MWNMHDFYWCGVKQELDYLHHGSGGVGLDVDSKFTKLDRMQSKKKQSPHTSAACAAPCCVIVHWFCSQHCLWLSIWLWCVRVIFVELESQALRVRGESESPKVFSSRVRVWVMTWSSRVRVESQELSSHFESLVCKLESSHTKFHIFSTKLFLLWNGTQHAIKS